MHYRTKTKLRTPTNNIKKNLSTTSEQLRLDSSNYVYVHQTEFTGLFGCVTESMPKHKWVSTRESGTFRIGEQQWLIRAQAFAQFRQCLLFSHIQSMEVAEVFDKTLDLSPTKYLLMHSLRVTSHKYDKYLILVYTVKIIISL